MRDASSSVDSAYVECAPSQFDNIRQPPAATRRTQELCEAPPRRRARLRADTTRRDWFAGGSPRRPTWKMPGAATSGPLCARDVCSARVFDPYPRLGGTAHLRYIRSGGDCAPVRSMYFARCPSWAGATLCGGNRGPRRRPSGAPANRPRRGVRPRPSGPTWLSQYGVRRWEGPTPPNRRHPTVPHAPSLLGRAVNGVERRALYADGPAF